MKYEYNWTRLNIRNLSLAFTEHNLPRTVSVTIQVCDGLNKCFLKMLTGTGCKIHVQKSSELVRVHRGTCRGDSRKLCESLLVGTGLVLFFFYNTSR